MEDWHRWHVQARCDGISSFSWDCSVQQFNSLSCHQLGSTSRSRENYRYTSRIIATMWLQVGTWHNKMTKFRCISIIHQIKVTEQIDRLTLVAGRLLLCQYTTEMYADQQQVYNQRLRPQPSLSRYTGPCSDLWYVTNPSSYKQSRSHIYGLYSLPITDLADINCKPCAQCYNIQASFPANMAG